MVYRWIVVSVGWWSSSMKGQLGKCQSLKETITSSSVSNWSIRTTFLDLMALSTQWTIVIIIVVNLRWMRLLSIQRKCEWLAWTTTTRSSARCIIIVGGQTSQAKPEKERVGRSPCRQQASGNNAGNTNVHQLVVWRWSVRSCAVVVLGLYPYKYMYINPIATGRCWVLRCVLVVQQWSWLVMQRIKSRIRSVRQNYNYITELCATE